MYYNKARRTNYCNKKNEPLFHDCNDIPFMEINPSRISKKFTSIMCANYAARNYTSNGNHPFDFNTS
jgi:hypothetical protein